MDQEKGGQPKRKCSAGLHQNTEAQRRRGENVKLNQYANIQRWGSKKAVKSPLSYCQKLGLCACLRHKLYKRECLWGSLLNLTPCSREVPQWGNWENFLHAIHNHFDIVFIQLAFENGDLVDDAVEK